MGFRVTASDITPAMLERVREGAAERGLKLQTRQHSAEALPYPDETLPGRLPRCAAPFFVSREFRKREWPGAEAGRLVSPDRWNGAGRRLGIGGMAASGREAARPEPQPAAAAPGMARALQRDGLSVQKVDVAYRKQPDLEWYFEAAATTKENQEKVRALIAAASEKVREQYRLAEEAGTIVWWWPMLTLVARNQRRFNRGRGARGFDPISWDSKGTLSL